MQNGEQDKGGQWVKLDKVKERPAITHDVIGFDADNSLIKYKAPAFPHLLVDCLLTELVTKFKYPQQLTVFDFKKHGEWACLQEDVAVWDIDNNLMLFVADDGKIKRAYQGFKLMKQSKLNKLYGEPPTYSKMRWPEHCRCVEYFEEGDGNHWTLVDGYYDSAKVAVICLFIALKQDKEFMPKKDAREFSFDLFEASNNLLQPVSADRVTPIAEHGRFFPELLRDPGKYILFQPDLEVLLSKLRV